MGYEIKGERAELGKNGGIYQLRSKNYSVSLNTRNRKIAEKMAEEEEIDTLIRYINIVSYDFEDENIREIIKIMIKIIEILKKKIEKLEGDI